MYQILLVVTLSLLCLANSVLLQSVCTPVDVSELDLHYVGKVNGTSLYTNLGNAGMSFQDAIDFCHYFGFTPVIIESEDVDVMLNDFLNRVSVNSTYNTRPFWLSLSDNETEGSFAWSHNNTPLQGYINWAENSPVTDPDNGPRINCVSVQQFVGGLKCVWINLPCDSTCWRPLCSRQ
ncbi:uncharacterized protein LOC110850256 [Folsomia candida]|uniref:Tetranectin-like protein n=1 Tax=Folsomia candida TaxID=158441 RepID=A0A226E9F5_FOLCA|nr:uncharacterized protein LOC110850256 [Folsomia candida]OXA54000.1 Tetranectin-like protein [Folsomia candida]